MDLKLRIADGGEDSLVYWFTVELLSPAGDVLDRDRFRFAKQFKRVLKNPPPDGSNPPPDWKPLMSVPRESNVFDYDILMDIAARHFLRRQGLIERGVAGQAWEPAGWAKRQGADLALPPEDRRHIPFLKDRLAAMRGAELLVDAPGIGGKLRKLPLRAGTLLTISADFDGFGNGGCADAGTTIVAGLNFPGSALRAYVKFPLATLPGGADVTDVDFKVNVVFASNAPVLDVQAYNQDGQANVETDSCSAPDAVRFPRCADDASPYLNNTTALQSSGIKTLQLPAAADADVESAKGAVDRFSLGINENSLTGSNKNANLESLENAGTDEPKLVVTYADAAAGRSQVVMI